MADNTQQVPVSAAAAAPDLARQLHNSIIIKVPIILAVITFSTTVLYLRMYLSRMSGDICQPA